MRNALTYDVVRKKYLMLLIVVAQNQIFIFEFFLYSLHTIETFSFEHSFLRQIWFINVILSKLFLCFSSDVFVVVLRYQLMVANIKSLFFFDPWNSSVRVFTCYLCDELICMIQEISQNVSRVATFKWKDEIWKEIQSSRKFTKTHSSRYR